MRTHLLGPLDLTLECRCTVSLSGPSGSGKSVLLRALADLDPHQGELLMDGVSSLRVRPHAWRRSVGYLPAESHWWSARVGDHFADDSNADSWLQALGFEPDVLRWEIMRLSSGERQRLALIRLLCNNPKVLLLDEPTANLDATNSARVEALLRQRRDESGAALLWVSHDPHQRQRVADRWVRLEGGRVVEESGCI